MTKDEYVAELERHDWYNAFSDDHSVYMRGESNRNRLLKIARDEGEEFQKAYNEAHAKRFNRNDFCGPYVAPFPKHWPADTKDCTIKTAYFTFGQQHVHKVGGFIYDKDVVVRVDHQNPRARMFQLFGNKWSMHYDEPPNMEYFPRGIHTVT